MTAFVRPKVGAVTLNPPPGVYNVSDLPGPAVFLAMLLEQQAEKDAAVGRRRGKLGINAQHVSRPEDPAKCSDPIRRQALMILMASCETEGAGMMYTLDGSEPTASSEYETGYRSYPYKAREGIPLSFIGKHSICVVALKKGCVPSKVQRFSYVLTRTETVFPGLGSGRPGSRVASCSPIGIPTHGGTTTLSRTGTPASGSRQSNSRQLQQRPTTQQSQRSRKTNIKASPSGKDDNADIVIRPPRGGGGSVEGKLNMLTLKGVKESTVNRSDLLRIREFAEIMQKPTTINTLSPRTATGAAPPFVPVLREYCTQGFLQQREKEVPLVMFEFKDARGGEFRSRSYQRVIMPNLNVKLTDDEEVSDISSLASNILRPGKKGAQKGQRAATPGQGADAGRRPFTPGRMTSGGTDTLSYGLSASEGNATTDISRTSIPSLRANTPGLVEGSSSLLDSGHHGLNISGLPPTAASALPSRPGTQLSMRSLGDLQSMVLKTRCGRPVLDRKIKRAKHRLEKAQHKSLTNAVNLQVYNFEQRVGIAPRPEDEEDVSDQDEADRYVKHMEAVKAKEDDRMRDSSLYKREAVRGVNLSITSMSGGNRGKGKADQAVMKSLFVASQSRKTRLVELLAHLPYRIIRANVGKTQYFHRTVIASLLPEWVRRNEFDNEELSAVLKPFTTIPATNDQPAEYDAWQFLNITRFTFWLIMGMREAVLLYIMGDWHKEIDGGGGARLGDPSAQVSKVELHVLVDAYRRVPGYNHGLVDRLVHAVHAELDYRDENRVPVREAFELFCTFPELAPLVHHLDPETEDTLTIGGS